MAETAALFVAHSQLQSLTCSGWSTSSTSPRQLALPELGLAAAGAGFPTILIAPVVPSSSLDDIMTYAYLQDPNRTSRV